MRNGFNLRFRYPKVTQEFRRIALPLTKKFDI